MKNILLVVGLSLTFFTTNIAPEIWYATTSLKVREGASVDTKSLGVLKKNSKVEVLNFTGDTVEISGAKGQWAEISYKKGKAFVFGGFLAKAPLDSASTPESTKVVLLKSLKCKKGVKATRDGCVPAVNPPVMSFADAQTFCTSQNLSLIDTSDLDALEKKGIHMKFWILDKRDFGSPSDNPYTSCYYEDYEQKRMCTSAMQASSTDELATVCK